MGSLAVGGPDEAQVGAEAGQPCQQAADPEHLVVGVRGEHDNRSVGQRRQVELGPPGRRQPVAPHRSRRCRPPARSASRPAGPVRPGRPAGVEASAAELLEVGLGVALPQVEQQVRDPAAVGGVEGQRRRTERPRRSARPLRPRSARPRRGPGRRSAAAVPAPSAGSASKDRAATASTASAAVRAASTAPAWASACGPSGRRPSARARARPISRAPPHHTAATPTAPCQKPGRSRYSCGPPTGSAGAPSNRTDRLSLPCIAAAGQVPSTAAARGSARSTANSRYPSSVRAVTSARSQAPGAAAPRLGAGRAAIRRQTRRASSGSTGGLAAQTPHRPSGRAVGSQFGADRGRVDVRLGQPGQVEVGAAEVGQGGEPLGRAAPTRQGQVEQPRVRTAPGPERGPLHRVRRRPAGGRQRGGAQAVVVVARQRLPRGGAVTRPESCAGSLVGSTSGIRAPGTRRDRTRSKGTDPMPRAVPHRLTCRPARRREPDPRRVFDLEVGTPDLVRLYLDEIGKAPLLDAATEVDLAQRIEAGLYARHLLDAARPPPGRQAPGGAQGGQLRRADPARRPGRGRQAGLHQGEPAAGRLAGPPLHPGLDAVARPHPGGQRRPGPRRGEVRLRTRLQVLDVRDLVDPAVHRPGHRRAEPHRAAARAPGREAQPARPDPA